MLTLFLLLNPPAAYTAPPKAYDDPPAVSAPADRDPTKVVVVSLGVVSWRAEYKGHVKLWPRTTPASVVEVEAGEFGRQVESGLVRAVVPRLFSPPLVPVLGGS